MSKKLIKHGIYVAIIIYLFFSFIKWEFIDFSDDMDRLSFACFNLIYWFAVGLCYAINVIFNNENCDDNNYE